MNFEVAYLIARERRLRESFGRLLGLLERRRVITEAELRDFLGDIRAPNDDLLGVLGNMTVEDVSDGEAG